MTAETFDPELLAGASHTGMWHVQMWKDGTVPACSRTNIGPPFVPANTVPRDRRCGAVGCRYAFKQADKAAGS
jgi:hypothetical protein